MLDTDVKALNQYYAELYRDGVHVPVLPQVQTLMDAAVDYWYGRIPVPVTWVREDPYKTCKAMADDIRAGTFKVHCPGLKYQSTVFKDRYRRFRAVHDYFGHFCVGNGFGLLGELSAYGVHVAQFPRECHPLIWNELIHVNAFRDHFGSYSNEDKLVLLP